MREQGLRVAARFAARTVANEIDLRWRILEGLAADGELRAWLKDQPAKKELQSWLEARRQECLRTTRASSWFVLDQHGTMLARSPASDSIGRNFAFRDYYHGQGDQLDPTAGRKQPIRDVHRSTIFAGKTTGNLRVTFSVPIWQTREKDSVLGVLAMSVELGCFSVLQLGLGEDQVAVLVDTGTDWLEGAPGKGLILHHPQLAELRAQPAQDRTVAPVVYRLPPSRVEMLQSLRDARLKQFEELETLPWQEQLTRKRPPLPGSVDPTYIDPVGGEYAGRWVAAFEPVFVRGRSGANQNTGWVVIIQERLPSS
jgi:hypothetical protein